MSNAFAACLLALQVGAHSALPDAPFYVRVVDDESGRGVPLVELRTTNEVWYYTDSNGIVAIADPDLAGQTVYFHVRSHGYEYPADGFGFRGKALIVMPGASAELRLTRTNVAERLYRITGGGIYRDSVMAGLAPPIENPLLNAQVFGSDSIVCAVYRGRVCWFWGDTNRPSYPLGNFHVPGAISALETLNPERGIELDYFRDESGFAKPTCEMPGEGPTWIGGLTVLTDGEGRERMFSCYAKIRGFLEAYERGIVEWDDGAKLWRKVKEIPVAGSLRPDGHPLMHNAEGGERYVYFATPYPLVRVRAEVDDLLSVERYEAYTPLVAGSSIKEPVLDRDGAGRLRYSWKCGAPALGVAEQAELLKRGVIKAHEALLQLRDIETGKQVVAHGGSVNWNDHRQRFVMIAVEIGGSASMLGEVWYAEADTPLGPWVYARKVVTHDKYSFYNPKHHAFLDRERGREIYFEGTYATTFSGSAVPTPRYDYNQIIYKLNLDDLRLRLPVGVWRREGGSLALGGDEPGEPPAFFAFDREGPGAVPVYAARDGLRLVPERAGEAPLFHGLAIEPEGAGQAPPSTALLRRYRGEDGGWVWGVEGDPALGHANADGAALCRVWISPFHPASSR